MDANVSPVTVLTEDDCWERLATEQVGRIVTHVGGVVDIVPINFVVDGRTIVFRTAAGSKLAGLTINSDVAFEVDRFDDSRGWSVVVRGEARALTLEAEVGAAEALPLRPFVPTLKPTFVRIVVSSVSGRAFEFGEELRREDAQEG